MPWRRARASRYSRSKRKMLWPSITSGSRSATILTTSRSNAGSSMRSPRITWRNPRLSARATATMRSPGRAGRARGQAGPLAAAVAGGERVAPALEAHEPPERRGALEGRLADDPVVARRQVDVAGEQERAERRGLGDDRAVHPVIEAHGVAAAGQRHRNQSRTRLPPEQQRRLRKIQRTQFKRPSSRWSSRRAEAWAGSRATAARSSRAAAVMS